GMISGGSDESRYEFRLTARLAAKAAGLVAGDATENEAVDRWLNLLKCPGSPYYFDGLTLIENLVDASVAMCTQLAAEGYQPGENATIHRESVTEQQGTEATRETPRDRLLTYTQAAKDPGIRQDRDDVVGK